MVPFVKVQEGVARFVDEEFIPQLEGWKKWVVGTGTGIIMSQSTEVFNHLKDNEMVKMLHLVNENDEVDIDTIYKELKKQAQKTGAITFNNSMIGTITLKPEDIDKLYTMIRQ